jgi:hypothetical protein
MKRETTYKELYMANTKKCAHDICTCVSTDGSKYCSPHCEAMAGKSELLCQCNHPGCAAHATKV